MDGNYIVNNGDIEIGNIGNMLELVGLHSKVIISSHPHRWSKSYFSALLHLIIFKTIRFTAKSLAKIGFVKKIMSKFYYLAKKI